MMQLKEYQERVVNEVERYLKAVVGEREAGNLRHAAVDAWRELRLGEYHERSNGLGEDDLNFTIKAPTGAGKTVLATQVLGSIYQTLVWYLRFSCYPPPASLETLIL